MNAFSWQRTKNNQHQRQIMHFYANLNLHIDCKLCRSWEKMLGSGQNCLCEQCQRISKMEKPWLSIYNVSIKLAALQGSRFVVKARTRHQWKSEVHWQPKHPDSVLRQKKTRRKKIDWEESSVKREIPVSGFFRLSPKHSHPSSPGFSRFGRSRLKLSLFSMRPELWQELERL